MLISQAESKIEKLESELEECSGRNSAGKSRIEELETKLKDLQSEEKKNQEALQEVKIALKQEVAKVKEEKQKSAELKKEVTRVTAEIAGQKENITALQSRLDSEREKAEKDRAELGESLRKATEEKSKGDEEGRNCSSPCMISKIAGNDLIEMSQKEEDGEVVEPLFESKDDVNGVAETTETMPTSVVDGLFF